MKKKYNPEPTTQLPTKPIKVPPAKVKTPRAAK